MRQLLLPADSNFKFPPAVLITTFDDEPLIWPPFGLTVMLFVLALRMSRISFSHPGGAFTGSKIVCAVVLAHMIVPPHAVAV